MNHWGQVLGLLQEINHDMAIRMFMKTLNSLFPTLVKVIIMQSECVKGEGTIINLRVVLLQIHVSADNGCKRRAVL